MAVYNSVYVDEKYSGVVIDALRTDTWLIPGVTYNADYATGDVAGGVVNFYSFAAAALAATSVGGDFSSAEPTNALTPVYVYNSYRASKKLYAQTADSITPDYAANVFNSIAEDVREGKELGALAALKAVSGVNTTAAALSASTIKGAIGQGWAGLRKAKAKPDILLMSPDAFSLLAEVQEGKFTPETNDELVKNGSIGKYFGMSVLVTPALASSANSAVSISTTQTTADAVSLQYTDFIIYSSKYFAMINNLTCARIKDSENFAGSLAQIEDNVGVRLLNTSCGFAWLSSAVSTT